MRPVISSGDVVRAFAVLKRASDTERRIIAELLGFTLRDPVAQAPISKPPPPTHAAPPPAGKGADVRPQPRATATELPKAPDTGTGVTVAGPAIRDAGSIPWTSAPGDFAAPESRANIAVAPLFEPRWTRAILSTALAGKGATGSLNLPEIVSAVAKRRPLRSLPRLPGGIIAPRVDLLLDVGESMMPFAGDQTALVAAVRTVVGADSVRHLKFVGSPLRGAGTDDDEVWPDYAFPATGTHVLLLTDFGIGRPPAGFTPAGNDEWRRFALALRKRQVGCTAFVPYPAARWPLEARRHFKIVQWDRATTAGNVKFSRRSALG